MKNSRRFLMIIILILIPFFVSCNNNKSDDELDQYGDYNFMSSAFSNINTVYTKDKEVRRIYFDTEGYNYYGDFKILIDDTVIFDMADYNYFLPATDDLCIPVDINPDDTNKIRTIIGDGAINMASLPKNRNVTISDMTEGNIELLSGFEGNVEGIEGLEIKKGNNKLVCSGISQGGIKVIPYEFTDVSSIKMSSEDGNPYAILTFTATTDYTMQANDIINVSDNGSEKLVCIPYTENNKECSFESNCFTIEGHSVLIEFYANAMANAKKKYKLDLPDGVYIKDSSNVVVIDKTHYEIYAIGRWPRLELTSHNAAKIDFTITRLS